MAKKIEPRRLVAVIATLLALLVACSIEDVDVSNKACPCGDGWVCDSARNTCVRPEELAVVGGGGGDAGAVCTGDQCPCAVDADCKDPAYTRCGATKKCVECSKTPDTCPAGSYCNDSAQCTFGCKQESDCQISPAAPHCNLERHQCVECTKASECAGGKLCSPAGVCVEGCDIPAGKLCPAGKECCQNLCLDLKTDPLNCGACGTKCSTTNGTPRCSAGACAWTCASGFGHCNTGNTGCETNLRTTLTRCGSCTRNCTTAILNANGVACTSGACTYTSCRTNFGSCDGNTANGCECACGAAVGDICCPGNVCNFPGGKCTGAGKCAP